MRPILRLAVCAIMSFVNVTVLFAQWERTGSIYGVNFGNVGAAGKWIVVGGYYSGDWPFSSTDGGESWSTHSGCGPVPFNTVLVTSGTDTFALAVGGSSSVYRLRDTASTWVRCDSGLGGAQVRWLAYAEGRGSPATGVVVAASPSSGLFVSTDGGEHWVPSDSGLTTLGTVTVTAIDSIFLVGTSNRGIFRSSDNGLSWSAANTGLPDTSVNALASASGWAFGASGTHVYRSSDRGESWSLMPGNLPADALNLVLLPTPGEGIGVAVFAVTSAGHYRLSADDPDWVRVKPTPSRIYSDMLPFTLAVVDSMLYAVDFDQVTCSADLGRSWRHLVDNSTNSGSREYATGHETSRYDHARVYLGPFMSTNFGSRWVSTHPVHDDGSHMTALTVSADTSAEGYDRLVAGTDSGAVEYSNDGGQTWKVLHQRPEHPTFSGAHGIYDVAELDGVVFATLQRSIMYQLDPGDTVAGVYRTTTEGATWEKMETSGLTSSLILSVDLFLGRDGGRILFAGNWFNLFRSTNDGESWSSLDSLSPVRSGRKRLRQVNGTLFLCTEGTVEVTYDNEGNMITTYDSAGVYRSTDDGLTWTEITGNLKSTFARGFVATSIPDYPDRVLLAASIDGSISGVNHFGDVLTSTEGGGQWTSFGFGLPPFSNSIPLGADARFVYCLGRRRPLSEAELTVVEPVEISSPTGFSLSQNYPNPFNPTTTITYSLPGRSRVSLTVFNILGQKVADLVNGENEPGVHTVQFDATNLASGVYFCKLSVNSFVDIKKMLLVE